MKRLLILAVMFLCCMANSFAQYSGSGNGTEDDPYLIYNENQLSQVSNFLNQEGVVFKLMKDLNLTNWIVENNPSQGWLPIGVESTPFKGVFYGNNHKITGLTINRTSTNNVGFFGYVTNATINNLTIEGTTVSGADNVGVLFGYISGSTVTNCHVLMTGNTGVLGASFVGGFAGYSINTSYSTFSVNTSVASSVGHAGGLIGKVEGGNFTDGSASGAISTTSGDYAGGLFGKATGFTLNSITVNSDITGRDYIGGITGYSATGSLTECAYEGTITGNQYVGGIVGSLESSTTSFTDCFTKGKITSSGDYVGGIVGISKGACISGMESCSHFGDIKGKNYVGGIVGAMLSIDILPHLCTYEMKLSDRYGSKKESISNGSGITIAINNCTAIGNINGGSWIGGLIGYDLSSYGYSPVTEIVSNLSYREYSPSLKRTITYYYYIYKDGIHISRDPTFTITNYIRNIITYSLTNSCYSGTIQGEDCVGGLVGLKGGGELSKNFSSARIYGKKDVGGIVGSTTYTENTEIPSITTIKSNVSICRVISATNSNLGCVYGSTAGDDYTNIGLLGSSEGNRSLSQTKLILQGIVQEVDDDLQNGTSIGPSALKLKANYVSWGWNFDENWNILETESYPYKKYQAAPPVIESDLVSQATSISGKSTNVGTVYLYYKDRDAVSTVCDGHQWSFATDALQSGALVQIYADVEGMTPSYFTTNTVGYPGSGTEDNPYRIYTAEDLQGASNRGYYKLMNDIDLTQWINENSPTEGWPAIGRNSGEATYIDGDGHKVTGLWMNTTQNYNGLFSNFSAGQIKNLTVEVATGKKVKGGDYTGILIGRNANGKIMNCTIKGDVEGIGHVGGVVGYVENTTISSVAAEANITGTLNVGGIAGQMSACNITTSNAATTIESSGIESKVGGLVGYAKGGSISKCIAENSLTAADESNYVGGLVGYSETPISLSFSAGNVTATGNDSYSGGLVGYTSSPIENCYSKANTNGTQFTAALVGYTFSSIDKCYAMGDVNGVMYGGGVVGELDGPAASISNSIAYCNTLSLTAQSSWGSRVIGGFKNGAAEPDNTNYALSTMQVSLNNVPQTKTDDSVEGIAKTKEELSIAQTYINIGWDFSNIWSINDGYPYLKMEESADVEMFTLTYKVDGEVYKQYELAVGDAITPEAAPTKDGYTFSGWSEIPETMPANDIEVVGTFTKIPVEPSTDNTLAISDADAYVGKQIVLPIDMNNVASIQAFQFDLYLPEGVTIAKDGDNEYMVELTSRAAKSHSISAQTRPDGAIRMVCTSLSGASFKGNEGTIVNVTLSVAPDMTAGNYEIKIKNIELSDGTPYNPADIKATLTVKAYTPGDVDGTGTVSVNDAVCIINYILGSPIEGFIEAAADLDGNGVITVNDVVILINDYILGDNSQNSLDLAFLEDVTADDDYLFINDITMKAGETTEVEVYMNTSRTDIQGLQCDIYLPDGMEFVPEEDGDEKYYADKGGRAAKSHSVAAQLREDGSVRVVETSTSGAKFKDNDQAVFYFTVKAKEDMVAGNYEIKLANMELSYGGTPINPSDRTAKVVITDPSAINGVNAEDAKSFVGKIIKDNKIIIMKNGKKHSVCGQEM